MTFRTVLVAGAGTMGRGIAELMALTGLEVQLWDYSPKALGKASAAIERSLRRQMDLGRITGERMDQTLGRIRLISDFRIVKSNTELAIETVIEDVKVKQDVLSSMEKSLPNAWFATNTSSLTIEHLSSAMQRSERLLGMHFFNPATVMPLVELVYCVRTSETWIRRAKEFIENQIGKQVIVVKDSPGFAATRLGMSLALEAMRMVEQNVASIEAIDKAMEYGYRHPMGPLRHSDWMGLDVRLSIAKILYEELRSEVFRPPLILEKMVAEGKLGRKSGEGFYKWPKEND